MLLNNEQNENQSMVKNITLKESHKKLIIFLKTTTTTKELFRFLFMNEKQRKTVLRSKSHKFGLLNKTIINKKKTKTESN